MSALVGVAEAVAVGAAQGVAASTDINAGRSQSNFFTASSLTNVAGLSVGIYGLVDRKPRVRAYTDPVLYASIGMLVRFSVFAALQDHQKLPPSIQGYAQARGYAGVNTRVGPGPLTPPTIFVTGDPRNQQKSQAGGLL